MMLAYNRTYLSLGYSHLSLGNCNLKSQPPDQRQLYPQTKLHLGNFTVLQGELLYIMIRIQFLPCTAFSFDTVLPQTLIEIVMDQVDA